MVRTPARSLCLHKTVSFAVVFWGCFALAHSQEVQLKVVSLPQPSGRYPVGVISREWRDVSRIDPEDPGSASRDLTTRIWYPSIGDSGATPAAYQDTTHDYSEVFGPELASTMASLSTTSVRGAPAAASSFPVLLVSPGFSVAVFNYTLLAEELASHGFVVAVVGHTGMNAVGLSGRGLLNPQGGFWHCWPVAENRSMSEEERRRMLRAALETFARDQLFVLEQLERLDSTEGWPLAGRLDLGRTASIGHSAGYLSPLGLMLRSQRFKAFCFLDATIDEAPAPAPPPRPPGFPALLLRLEYARPPKQEFLALFNGPFYDVHLTGANHLSVTDLPYLGSLGVRDGGSTRKALEDVRVACGYLRSFLGTCLSGAGKERSDWHPEPHDGVSVRRLQPRTP